MSAQTSPYRVLPQTNGRRVRLYPRAVEVLRRIDRQNAPLVRNPVDGKYRIGGVQKRSETVIPRSLRSLLRTQAVRQIGGSDDRLMITEAGKRILRRYSDVVVDVQGRRLMRMGVRKYEKRVQVQAVVFDGQNIGDVHELAGQGKYQLEWNPKENLVEVMVTVGSGLARLDPTKHILVRDEDERLSIMNAGDFKNEFRELRAG